MYDKIKALLDYDLDGLIDIDNSILNEKSEIGGMKLNLNTNNYESIIDFTYRYRCVAKGKLLTHKEFAYSKDKADVLKAVFDLLMDGNFKKLTKLASAVNAKFEELRANRDYPLTEGAESEGVEEVEELEEEVQKVVTKKLSVIKRRTPKKPTKEPTKKKD